MYDALWSGIQGLVIRVHTPHTEGGRVDIRVRVIAGTSGKGWKADLVKDCWQFVELSVPT